MKKLLALLMTGVLMLSLAACGRSQSAAMKAPTEENVITPAEAAAGTAAEVFADVTIYAFIAASLKNVMEEIADEYATIAPNVNIVYQADSSGTLQTQIEEGAECDLFFSAAMKQMNALKDGGYTVDDSINELLENKVVLIKPAGGETAVTGFENITDAANLALAGPDVPVGQYARAIFENIGIAAAVEALEINEAINVTAVLTAVSEGSNEIGIVYATDAASMPDSVEIIAEAPEDSLDTPVIYPVSLIQNPEADESRSAAAEAFLEYLTTDEVRIIFEAHGFSAGK